MTNHTRGEASRPRSTVLTLHPLATFFTVTFVLAWAVWLPVVLLRDDLPSGVGFVLTLTGSLVPSAVAIVLVVMLHGSAGLQTLLRRLLMWRVGVRWYVAIIALSGLALCAMVLSIVLGAPAPEVTTTLPLAVALFAFSIFPGSALGEEIGWRGYALPRLQARRSALTASVILGAVWGTYHLPLFLIGAETRPPSLFLPFLISTVISSIFYTWMYNGTGGSLFIVVLLHAAANLPLTIVYGPLDERVLPAFWLYVALLALAAATVAAVNGTATLAGKLDKQTVTD